MKTKISVDLKKSGNNNSKLLNVIAMHNEGTLIITPEGMKGILAYLKSEYPHMNAELCETYLEPEMFISEDNHKSLTLVLMWKEVYEIDDNNHEAFSDKELEADNARSAK